MENNINEFVFDGDFDAKIYDLVNDMQKYNEERRKQVVDNNKIKKENDYDIQAYKTQREVIDNEIKKLSSYQSRFVEEDETYKEYQEEIDKNNSQIKELEKKIKEVAKENKKLEASNKEIKSNSKEKPEIQEFYKRRDELIAALKQKEKDIIVTKRNEVKQQKRNIEILKNDIEALKRGIESEEKFSQYSNSTANLEYKKNLLAQKEELYSDGQAKLYDLQANMNLEIDKELEAIDVRIVYLEKITIEQVDELSIPTVGQVKGKEQEPVVEEQEPQQENSLEEKENLKKQLEDVYKNIEKGYEDLLSEGYLYMKEVSLESDNIAEQIPVMQTMTLLDIYKEQYEFFSNQEDKEKYTDDLKELKDLMEKVEKRKEELEKAQEAQEKQEPKSGEQENKTESKGESTKQKEENTSTVGQDKKEKEAGTKNEQNESKTKENSENSASQTKQQAKNGPVRLYENQAQVIPPKKVLTMDDLQGTSKPTKPTKTEEQKDNIKFIVDIRKGSISILTNENGEEVEYTVQNIAESIKEGKSVKKDFVKNIDVFFKAEVKKVDPIILGALEMIAQYQPELKEKMIRIQEKYVEDFVNSGNVTKKSKNIDSINYIFGNSDEIDYKDKTVKQAKKFAKNARDLGLATVEKLEETGPIAKFMNWVGNLNKKRLENKEMKEQRKQQAKENKILSKKEERKVFIKTMPEQKKEEHKEKIVSVGPEFKSATINRSGEGR